MKCEAKKHPPGRVLGVPCLNPARYLVLAPGAPPVVCGTHARAYTKNALLPLAALGPGFNMDHWPRINAFLEAMRDLGARITTGLVYEKPTIMINFEAGGRKIVKKSDPRYEADQGAPGV